MMDDTRKVLENLLHLPRHERAFLAEMLLDSLDREDDRLFELSDEWRDELARRCEQIDRGDVEMIPVEQVLRELREELG